MSPARRRNLIKAPVVLLVRAPIMAVVIAITMIAEALKPLGEWLHTNLPGFEQE